jgi:hypothetical protein
VSGSLGVCASGDACAGVYDACPTVDSPAGCQSGALCCEALEGNRCVVGDTCPGLPDPILETCLSNALQCGGADREVGACVDFSPRLDRVEGALGGGVEATWYSYQGQDALVVTNEGRGCFEAVEGEAGYTIRDLIGLATHEVVVEGQVARIDCADGAQQEVPLAALRRYLVDRPSGCAAAQFDDGCDVDADCYGIDTSFVCCDVGDARQCTPRGACPSLEPTEVCAQDADCEMGEVCCVQEQARACEPTTCGLQGLCCDLEDARVCATQARCDGIVDLCDLEAPGSCGPDAVCCPGLSGTTCFNGDACPIEEDPVAQSCLGPLLGCVGRDAEQVSCLDWSPLDLTRAQYDDQGEVIFFTRYQQEAWRTQFNGAACYDALVGPEGELVFQGLGVDQAQISVTFADGRATIGCPGAPVVVAEALLRAWLPRRPAPEGCADGRQDLCEGDEECARGEVCCDTGAGSECLTGAECVERTARPICTDTQGDEECGPGTRCCAPPLDVVQVCDPAVCGPINACCVVPPRLVCATDAACNGVFDTCDVNNAQSCAQGSLCCETLQGATCLSVGQCPAPPDPDRGDLPGARVRVLCALRPAGRLRGLEPSP